MLELSYDDKIKLMDLLNWDTLDKSEDILAVIEGHLQHSESFTRDKLFIRSLERLPWHYVTALSRGYYNHRYSDDLDLQI